MKKEQDTILDDFLKKFLSEQTELPPEFQKVVDDHFWELIDDTKELIKESKNGTDKSGTCDTN